jgi:hypothetical protein
VQKLANEFLGQLGTIDGKLYARGQKGIVRVSGTTTELVLPLVSSNDLMSFGSQILVIADDDTGHGQEPMLFDGARLSLLGDLAPGAKSSSPGEVTIVGGRAFFTADDGAHGREPWTMGVP